MDKDTGKVFEDGANILYVNAEFRERARYLKKAEGGVSTMCKEMEELAAAAFDEGIAKKELM